MEAVAGHSGIVILAGTEAWPADGRTPADLVNVAFPVPEFASRRAYWQSSLAAQGVALDARELDTLAGRFRLTPGQIEGAVCSARNRVRWRAAASPDAGTASTGSPPASITLVDVFAGARAQGGHELAKLTRKIEAKQTWDDIVLPPDQSSQLREVCEQARYRHMVYGDWGFDRKLSLGKGLNVLFAGPPGTGKTMAAEVIAGELQLDLYKIDLSQVVSKYIGETEKNLDGIFTAAESANAILFFDEADALFGKRSEVKDAHDRYANVEIGYLLQKMEEYEGVAILATNLRQNLDEAFVRRMHCVVDFPFPDEAHRRRIWEVTFPRQAPLGTDIDYGALAREVKLAGGNIKNIALAAAFYAAADGHVINLAHIAHAARREHQKLGRTFDERALSPRAIGPS
jgi:DNA polymerase III delta prime subunit